MHTLRQNVEFVRDQNRKYLNSENKGLPSNSEFTVLQKGNALISHKLIQDKRIMYAGPSSLGQLDAPFNQLVFRRLWVCQRFGHEIISTAIFFLPLIQVGQLSVTVESMGT